jgi:transposase
MPRGRQRRVRAPGQNRKQTVFGAWAYGRGLFYSHVQPRKTAWGFRLLLPQLVRRAKRTARKIVLVMDQGNPHHAKAVKNDLQVVKEHVEVFWLPHYCPELNLIERLWKHLKASRMANVLFANLGHFTQHLRDALSDFAQNPDITIGLMAQPCHQPNRKTLLVGT